MTDKTAPASTDVYDDEAVLINMRDRYVAAGSGDDPVTARADVVEALAAELGKPVASIRGKLSFMSVYVAQVVAVKGNVVTKNHLADTIGKIALDTYELRMSDGEIESLAKANKTVLRKLITMLEVSASEDDLEFVDPELSNKQ